MRKSFSRTVKQVALCVGVTGLSGAALVWAAPKAKTKTSSSKSKAPVAKSSTGKSSAAKKPTSQSKAASSVAKPAVTKKADAVATKADSTQLQTGFTPSRFPGVVVRSVPSAPPVMTSDLATASGGPVISNVRPAPGGGMMADVKFPREVETLDNLVTEKQAAQKTSSKASPKR